jgi:hypothetical protein
LRAPTAAVASQGLRALVTTPWPTRRTMDRACICASHGRGHYRGDAGAGQRRR